MGRRKKKPPPGGGPPTPVAPEKLSSPFAEALRGVRIADAKSDEERAAGPPRKPPVPRKDPPAPKPSPPRAPSSSPSGPVKDALEGYSYEDRAAFNQAFAGVAPLGAAGAEKRSQRTQPRQAVRVSRAPEAVEDAAARSRLAQLVAGGFRFTVERDEEWVQGHRAGQRVGPLRELRGGAAGAEAQLDLHGQRETQAIQSLVRFLRAARANRRQIVRVIHGRGHHSAGGVGVLGDAVVQAITEGDAAPYVLAFVTCSRAQGGPGALLLRLDLG